MHADEREFYDAVEEYIRTGYNALEQIEDPTHRRAIGFILTSFQKMNASSLTCDSSGVERSLGPPGEETGTVFPPKRRKQDATRAMKASRKSKQP